MTPTKENSSVDLNAGVLNQAPQEETTSKKCAGIDEALPIVYAIHEGKNSKYWLRGSVTWAGVLEWMNAPANYKEGRGYVFGTLAGEDPKKLERNKETVRSRSAITLDVDTPNVDFLNRLKGVLEGYELVIHTTSSSTAAMPRYRIILPLGAPLLPADYRAAAGEIIRRVSPDGGEFDVGSSQPERFMYPPSVQPGQEFWFEVWEGRRLDASELAEAGREQAAVALSAGSEAETEVYAAMSLERRANVDSYIAGAVGGVMKDLEFSDAMDIGSTDANGDGWEKIQANAARRLIGLARAGWNAYTIEDAREDYESAAPTDAGWTSTEVREKFSSELRKAPPAEMPMLKGDDPKAAEGAALDHRERLVAAELERLEVREEARRRFSALNRIAPEMPDAIGLDALLEATPDAPRWRITGMWPADARINLVATAKAGKTTTTANLVRSLADGEDFLGHSVVPLGAGKTVTVFDTEMTELQLRDWYDDLGLENPDKVQIVPIMGRAAGLNFLDDDTLRTLIERYKGAHTYILDPIGPVLSGLGMDENSNTDVQRFLSGWDAFVTLMGGRESVIVHHAGHAAERARGASAFLGSGSAIWTLTTDDPNNPDTQRYFRAMGRDVNIPVTPLTYEPSSRRLTLGSVSKAQLQRETKLNKLRGPMLEVIIGKPGLSTREIEGHLRDNGVAFQKGDASAALGLALDRGLIEMKQDGPSKRYYPDQRGQA